METPALSCALCNLFGSNDKNERRFSNMKEAKNHARLHFDQVKIFDEEIDEEQMFERCIPKSQRKVERDGSSQGVQSLRDYCRSLFGNHPKLSCIDCNLCGLQIKIVVDEKYLMTEPIIDHACVHADVKPFKCRRCEISFRSRRNVTDHFIRVHGTKLTNDHFEDQSGKFYEGISNSIKRCFTKCEDGAPSTETQHMTRDEIATRHGRTTNASELAIQRQLFFYRTMKKRIDSDGKIKCRLCSKRIKASRCAKSDGGEVFKTENAIRHAHSHLRKPLYRCGLCKECFNTNPTMRIHLKTKHTLGMVKNHECLADDFHSDILAVFAQCYEKDGSAD